jgi:clan AA aspartic protease
MGRVVVEVDLANFGDVEMATRGAMDPEKVRRARVSAIVDTGATLMVLPKKTAVQLGVRTIGKAKVRYADQRRASRTVVGSVQVKLLGRDGVFKAIVEPTREDALIGAIVMEDLDLMVDCRTQTLKPRDPDQFIAEIE